MEKAKQEEAKYRGLLQEQIISEEAFEKGMHIDYQPGEGYCVSFWPDGDMSIQAAIEHAKAHGRLGVEDFRVDK